MIGLTIMRKVDPTERLDPVSKTAFLYGYALTVVLALYLLASSLVDALAHDLAPNHAVAMVAVTLLLVASYWLLPLRALWRPCDRRGGGGEAGGMGLKRAEEGLLDSSSSSSSSSSSKSSSLGNGNSDIDMYSDQDRDPERCDGEETGAGEDRELSICQVLLKPSLWLIFFVVTCISGAGLLVINNISQMAIAIHGAGGTGGAGGHVNGSSLSPSPVPSLSVSPSPSPSPSPSCPSGGGGAGGGAGGATPLNTAVFVSLLSVCNCFGRLLTGVVAVRVKNSVPLPALLVGSSGVMACAMVAMAFANLTLLYPLVCVVGLMFGSVWVLLPAMISDIYGDKCLATIYNFLNFAPLLGSFLVGSKLPAAIYDAQAAAQGHPRYCYGTRCFRAAFLVSAGSLAVATIAAAALVKMTLPRYRRAWRMRRLAP